MKMKIGISFLTGMVLASLLLVSCNTGIEGTGTIRMSRAERRETRPTAEDMLARQIFSDSLAAWRPGKPFYVSDNKIDLILEHPDNPEIRLEGDTLLFDGVEERGAAGTERHCVLRFRNGENFLRYNTGKDLASARNTLTGLDVPLLIDIDMVMLADSILRGRTLWTLTPLWYDDNGEIMAGRKYVPVRITSVEAGNSVFPFLISFTDADGNPAHLLMGTRSASGLGSETRTFPALFSLTDPKEKYPSILPEVWELICDGRVRTGMTKNECKLALGNPSEVDAGHNWSNTIDVWTYKDGTFLHFENGLLVNFRH